MTYREIAIDSHADSAVRRLVRTRVDMYLHDAHAMLRLPLHAAGIEAGCNFTLAASLCSVVAGLSRVFLPHIKPAGEAFRRILVEYPYDEEPTDAIIRDEFAEQLYDTYRNNVAHSLGINVEWDGAQQTIRALGDVKIARQCPSMSEAQLFELEAETRPAWLGRTLELDGRTYKLAVEALYWGVRTLTQRLAVTEPYATDARRMLATADDGYGLSLMGALGPRYQAGTEISATATAVTSAASPVGFDTVKPGGTL